MTLNHSKWLTTEALGAPPTAPRICTDEKPIEGFLDNGHLDWAGFDHNVRSSGEAWQAVAREIHEGSALGSVLDGFTGQLRSSAPAWQRSKIEHDHSNGRNPHMPTIMRGAPGGWDQTSRRPKPKAVRIAVQIGGHCGIDANDLVWSGAVCLLLAEQAAAAGNPVEIIAVDSRRTIGGQKYGERFTQALIVKQAHEELIPDLLAAIIASPRVYRLGFLAHSETIPVCMTGHGAQHRMDADDLEFINAPDAIRVEACHSKNAALAELKRHTVAEE